MRPDQAWRTLELALAGESVLTVADRADDKAFREQVRLFILNAQCAGRVATERDFISRCLGELRAARTKGVLGGDADPAALAVRLSDLTRFSDPAALVASQWALAEELAADFTAYGFTTLAAFVALRPSSDQSAVPLLAVAVRYYFRRAVEDDPKLFQGLAFAQLERLGKAQEDGAAALAELMSRYVERLDTRLGELKDTASATRAEVRELREAFNGSQSPPPWPPSLQGRGERCEEASSKTANAIEHRQALSPPPFREGGAGGWVLFAPRPHGGRRVHRGVARTARGLSAGARRIMGCGCGIWSPGAKSAAWRGIVTEFAASPSARMAGGFSPARSISLFGCGIWMRGWN